MHDLTDTRSELHVQRVGAVSAFAGTITPSTAIPSKARPLRESVQAALILAIILNVIFFPFIWGNRTLLASAWVPSVMPEGAYRHGDAQPLYPISPDVGAPAWQSEAWIKVISDQYLYEHHVPLWNPYSGYGTPFAAAMQPQPFFPPTALLSLHPTPWTYNLFIISRLFLAGFLTFLFARFFLDYASALFAATIFMLNGYFVSFLDMPHLSVEVLLPAILLGAELLLRQDRWPAIAPLAAATFLSLVGGMPESSFLAIGFGSFYYVYRALTGPEFRGRRLPSIAKFGVALSAGFGLSALLLLPFAEFMRHSHDSHQAVNLPPDDISGLIYDHEWRSATTYLLPGLYGSVSNAIFGNPWGGGFIAQLGVLQVLFSIAAILGILTSSKLQFGKHKLPAIFFLISLVLLFLKKFGSPLINWVGGLPVARMVLFVKYQEPLTAFCVALLAGLGLLLVTKTRAGTRYLAVASVTSIILLAAVAAWLSLSVNFKPEIAARLYWTIFVGGATVLAAALLSGLSPKFPRARWLSWSLLGLLVTELFFGFIFPVYYKSYQPPSAVRDNPYNGAPYIAFLERHDRDNYRVFGRQGFLFPNWAGVFGLADVRDLDAMYERRYIKFIRNFFLRPGDEARVHNELADRFTGTGEGYTYDFKTDAELRFLILSSVKYVISPNDVSSGATARRRIGPDAGDTPFQDIYEEEVIISEFKSALPRASLFYSAEIVPDDEVLARLKDGAFDPSRQVLISEPLPSPYDSGRVGSFRTGASRPAQRARIVASDSQRVLIESESDAPAILMLNDTNYPGWRVSVNGQPAAMLTADYLFRAVVVPAGHAEVEFTYAPMSFRIGAVISIATLLGLIVLSALGSRRFRANKGAPGTGPIGFRPVAHDQSSAAMPKGTTS